MKVRMYNVGFGDCFCLRDRKKSLLVDFGTNNSRIEGRPRREIFRSDYFRFIHDQQQKSAPDTFPYGSFIRITLYDEKEGYFC